MKKTLLIMAAFALSGFSMAATNTENSRSSKPPLDTSDSTGSTGGASDSSGVTDSTGATGDTSSLGSTSNDTGAVNSTDSMGYHSSDESNRDFSTAQDEDSSANAGASSDASKPYIARGDKSRTLKSRTTYPSDIDTERAPSSGADTSNLRGPSKEKSSLPSDTTGTDNLAPSSSP